MKRNLEAKNDRQPRKPKVQRSLTSMFGIQGPKFVEAIGTLLICPYCRHKFRAPQGLIAHKHMYERAGDNILPKARLNFNNYSRECLKPPPPAGIDGLPAARPTPSAHTCNREG